MKTDRVELVSWQPDGSEQIEIDWPKVHKTIGVDHTNWLLTQTADVCQLMLERNGTHCRLIAEFYCERTLANYHLMWAK